MPALPSIVPPLRRPCAAGSVRLLLPLCASLAGSLGAQPPVPPNPPASAAAGSTPVKARPVLPRFVATAADTLWLGEPRARVAMYAEFPGDTMIRLPLLAASDADGVLFYIGPTGTIQRIAMVYNEQRPIAAMLEQHLRDFGPPADQRSAPVPDGLRESWSWQDADTYMTFTRFTPDQNAVGAIMVITNLRR